MARRKKVDVSAPVAEEVRAESPDNVTEIDGGKAPKKLPPLPLKDDETLDWDGMRESTRERVRKAIGAVVLGQGLPEAVVKSLLEAIGRVEVAIMPQLLKIDAKYAETFAFTDEDLAILVPAVVDISKKYDLGAGRWMEEINLAFALITVHWGKIIVVRRGIQMERAARSTHDAQAQAA